MNGIDMAQRGTPIELLTALNLTNALGGGSRPDHLGCGAELRGWAQSRLMRCFDTSAFAQPAAFRCGNVPRSQPNARIQGVHNWDKSIFVNTRFGPEGAVSIRAFQSFQPCAIQSGRQCAGEG